MPFKAKLIAILTATSIAIMAILTSVLLLRAPIPESTVQLYRLDERALEQLLLEVGPLEADDNDVNAQSLFNHCSNGAVDSQAFCAGYALGFSDGFSTGSKFDLDLCVAEQVRSADQIIKAYDNFIQDHPEHWKKPRELVMLSALLESFPCGHPEDK